MNDFCRYINIFIVLAPPDRPPPAAAAQAAPGRWVAPPLLAAAQRGGARAAPLCSAPHPRCSATLRTARTAPLRTRAAPLCSGVFLTVPYRSAPAPLRTSPFTPGSAARSAPHRRAPHRTAPPGSAARSGSPPWPRGAAPGPPHLPAPLLALRPFTPLHDPPRERWSRPAHSCAGAQGGSGRGSPWERPVPGSGSFAPGRRALL